MKQLLAWTRSANSTITSEAVMAMAEKHGGNSEDNRETLPDWQKEPFVREWPDQLLCES